MNISVTIRRLLRRWYILLPGLLIAVSLGVAAWMVIPPKYERTATQVLLPGTSSLPDNANPYYYLGGLSQAADVLVRAVGSENVLSEIQAEHPGVTVEVSRDPTTSGPVVYIAVTAPSDGEAAAVLHLLVEKTVSELDALQDVSEAAKADRISVVPVSVDESSTLRQRERLVGTVGVVGLLSALTILIAAVVEGLSSRSARRRQESEGGHQSDHDRLSRPTAGLRPIAGSGGQMPPAQLQLGRSTAPRRQISSARSVRARGSADSQ